MNPEDLDFEEQERIAEEDRVMQKEEETQSKKCGQFDLLVMQNRIGKFRVTDALVQFGLGELMSKVFSKVFIARAEHLGYMPCTEYVGYSELFKPLELGDEPLDYVFEAKKEEDGRITISSKALEGSLS